MLIFLCSDSSLNHNKTFQDLVGFCHKVCFIFDHQSHLDDMKSQFLNWMESESISIDYSFNLLEDVKKYHDGLLVLN